MVLYIYIYFSFVCQLQHFLLVAHRFHPVVVSISRNLFEYFIIRYRDTATVVVLMEQ